MRVKTMYFCGNYLLVLIHISQHLTHFVLLINTYPLSFLIHISQHLTHFVLLINTYPLSFLIRHRHPSTIDRFNEGGHTSHITSR